MHAANSPSWKILIVEDEALLAEELRDRLQSLGHHVVGVVDTGADALIAASEQMPDLVMMDIRIKGSIDGIQAGDRIYRKFGIPVVFASAHSDRDTLQQAQIPGQFGYIIKPFREQDLVMAIRLAMHRHDAEVDLQKSQMTYSTILSNITDSVIVTSPEGHVRFMNAAAEALTGWRIDDARDQPLDRILTLRFENGKPALAQDIRHADVDVTATWEGDAYVLINRMGIEANIKAIATPVHGHRGQTLGTAILIRNITHRHNIDMCIQHLINASPDAVMLTDETGRITLTNQRAETVFGYTREELHGKPLEMLVAERFRSEYRSMRDRYLTDSNLRQQDDLRDIYGVRKDGTELPLELTVSSVKSDERLSVFFVIKNYASAQIGNAGIWSPDNFDLLTGLPNRHQFLARLTWAVAHVSNDKSVVLLVIDIDNYSEIANALDHDARDRLVRAVAQRIQKLVREKNTVARIDASTFAVVVPNLYDLRVADRMAQRLVQKMALPFEGITDKQIHLTASVGIAAHPSDADTADDVLKHALQAAQTAHAQAGNRFVHFSPARQNDSQKWRALLDDLHGALERNEFVLHYQPLISLPTGHAVKAETLLRWNHPERGMISPFEFQPLLEESGLIHEVGAWMFDEALAFAAYLEKTLGRTIQIGINLSAEQLAAWNSGAVKWSQKLAALPSQKKRVSIIVTESTLVDHPQLAREHLPEFKARGIDIVIDGFGTRFSSLSYLKMFTFDYLRIDASFVRNITRDESDHALTEAITTIAHELGAKAVARGVETEAQREALLEIGCDFGQGALFSAPLSATELETLLATSPKAKGKAHVKKIAR